MLTQLGYVVMVKVCLHDKINKVSVIDKLVLFQEEDDDEVVGDTSALLGKRQTYTAPAAVLNDIPQVHSNSMTLSSSHLSKEALDSSEN